MRLSLIRADSRWNGGTVFIVQSLVDDGSVLQSDLRVYKTLKQDVIKTSVI